MKKKETNYHFCTQTHILSEFEAVYPYSNYSMLLLCIHGLKSSDISMELEDMKRIKASRVGLSYKISQLFCPLKIFKEKIICHNLWNYHEESRFVQDYSNFIIRKKGISFLIFIDYSVRCYSSAIFVCYCCQWNYAFYSVKMVFYH